MNPTPCESLQIIAFIAGIVTILIIGLATIQISIWVQNYLQKKREKKEEAEQDKINAAIIQSAKYQKGDLLEFRSANGSWIKGVVYRVVVMFNKPCYFWSNDEGKWYEDDENAIRRRNEK
jgi:hypothetical protein